MEYGTEKPTKKEKKILEDFMWLIRMKKRGFTKWWVNRIDNIILESLGMVEEKKIKKHLKEVRY